MKFMQHVNLLKVVLIIIGCIFLGSVGYYFWQQRTHLARLDLVGAVNSHTHAHSAKAQNVAVANQQVSVWAFAQRHKDQRQVTVSLRFLGHNGHVPKKLQILLLPLTTKNKPVPVWNFTSKSAQLSAHKRWGSNLLVIKAQQSFSAPIQKDYQFTFQVANNRQLHLLSWAVIWPDGQAVNN
ncbi:hypothetical protein EQ500_03000, partial [Lactobacillus sp. XV13L]|nr:hypothetical protein [Lactobacillus sp. XV13L]